MKEKKRWKMVIVGALAMLAVAWALHACGSSSSDTTTTTHTMTLKGATS